MHSTEPHTGKHAIMQQQMCFSNPAWQPPENKNGTGDLKQTACGLELNGMDWQLKDQLHCLDSSSPRQRNSTLVARVLKLNLCHKLLEFYNDICGCLSRKRFVHLSGAEARLCAQFPSHETLDQSVGHAWPLSRVPSSATRSTGQYGFWLLL